MPVIKTGLGERLVSNDVEGKSFTELPVIDLSRLQSDSVEERRALAAEVRYTLCNLAGPIADYRAPAGPGGEVDSLSLVIRRVPSAHSARSPRLACPLLLRRAYCNRLLLRPASSTSRTTECRRMCSTLRSTRQRPFSRNPWRKRWKSTTSSETASRVTFVSCGARAFKTFLPVERKRSRARAGSIEFGG